MSVKQAVFAFIVGAFVGVGPAMAQDNAHLSQGEWEKTQDSAPAASKDAPAWMQYNSPYVQNREDLSISHMSAPEITAWAQEAVSDVLSFGPDDYTERLTSFKKYFAVSGWQGYTDYLTKNGLPNLVKGDLYTLNAIVSENPDILKQGAVQGAYRWLIKTSAVLSLSRNSGTGELKTVPSTSRKIDVIVQLVRQEGKGASGLAIELWQTANAATSH